EFHYTYLHPGEAELIDANLIRATCLVGTADALVEQVRELERQGLQELMFAIGVDEKWRGAEASARGGIARGWGETETRPRCVSSVNTNITTIADSDTCRKL